MTFIIPKTPMPSYDASVATTLRRSLDKLRSTGILAVTSGFASDNGMISYSKEVSFVVEKMRHGMREYFITDDIPQSEDRWILAGISPFIAKSIEYTPHLDKIISRMGRGQNSHQTYADIHILPGGVLVCWDTAGLDMCYTERDMQQDYSGDVSDFFPSQATFETSFHAFIPEGTNEEDAGHFAAYVEKIVPALILRTVINWDRPTNDLADRYRASTFQLA